MIAPSWYPDRRQLRQFAGFTLVGFGVLGAVLWLSFGSLRTATVLWAVGMITFLIGMPFPDAIRLPYVVLMGLTLPIGWLISNLLLWVIFYGVFTPLGLVFRLVGRDPLQLRRPTTPTFWRPYPQRRDIAGYFRQS